MKNLLACFVAVQFPHMFFLAAIIIRSEEEIQAIFTTIESGTTV